MCSQHHHQNVCFNDKFESRVLKTKLENRNNELSIISQNKTESKEEHESI